MCKVSLLWCFICKVSILFSAVYAKCPYYVVLYMQGVLMLYCFICKVLIMYCFICNVSLLCTWGNLDGLLSFALAGHDGTARANMTMSWRCTASSSSSRLAAGTSPRTTGRSPPSPRWDTAISVRPPPWPQCCIKYCPEDKIDVPLPARNNIEVARPMSRMQRLGEVIKPIR